MSYDPMPFSYSLFRDASHNAAGWMWCDLAVEGFKVAQRDASAEDHKPQREQELANEGE